jgi:hypothetical protein
MEPDPNEQVLEWLKAHPYGEQDENGVDLSLLRANLKLTPAQRLAKLQRAWGTVLEIKSVFLLQHLHVLLPQEEQSVKTIGVYSSKEEALAAVERLKMQPGFVESPQLIDPQVEGVVSGFYLDEYPLNRDHWAEGFVTEYYEEE